MEKTNIIDSLESSMLALKYDCIKVNDMELRINNYGQVLTNQCKFGKFFINKYLCI